MADQFIKARQRENRDNQSDPIHIALGTHLLALNAFFEFARAGDVGVEPARVAVEAGKAALDSVDGLTGPGELKRKKRDHDPH
jgi:hypothetical protein